MILKENIQCIDAKFPEMTSSVDLSSLIWSKISSVATFAASKNPRFSLSNWALSSDLATSTFSGPDELTWGFFCLNVDFSLNLDQSIAN